MNAQEPVRVRVSPLVYLAGIFAAVLLVAMVCLLVVQLSVLTDQRRLLESQETKIERVERSADPLLRKAEPAIEEAEPLLRQVRVLLGPADESLASVTEAADALPNVLRGTDTLLADAIPLVRALVADDRAVRMLDTTQRVLASVEHAELIPRTTHALRRFEDLLSESVQVQRRSLRVQRRTQRILIASFRTQLRTAGMLSESIAIQRETLEHTRSIDRKTGPPPPQAPPPPAPVASAP